MINRAEKRFLNIFSPSQKIELVKECVQFLPIEKTKFTIMMLDIIFDTISSSDDLAIHYLNIIESLSACSKLKSWINFLVSQGYKFAEKWLKKIQE